MLLPGFEPLAQCILDRGAAIGVNPAVTLDHVENEGGRQFANSDWKRAVGEVEPLRRNLQQGFLRRANEQGFLRRSFRRAAEGGKGPVTALLYRADVENLTAIKAVVDAVVAAVGEELADLQIIVFSCRQRAFRDLGGTKLVMEDVPV